MVSFLTEKFMFAGSGWAMLDFGQVFQETRSSGKCGICLDNLGPRLSNRMVSSPELATNTSAFSPRFLPAANLIRNFLCPHLNCQQNDQQDRNWERSWARCRKPLVMTSVWSLELSSSPASCLPGHPERFGPAPWGRTPTSVGTMRFPSELGHWGPRQKMGFCSTGAHAVLYLQVTLGASLRAIWILSPPSTMWLTLGNVLEVCESPVSSSKKNENKPNL